MHAQVHERSDRAGKTQGGEPPQDRQLDMHVGVTGADDDAVVAIDKQIPGKPVAPCFYRKKQPKQHGAVRDRSGGDPATPAVEHDCAMHPVQRSRKQGAQCQSVEEPILEFDIGGKGKQIETEILSEKRIARAVRNLINKPQDKIPVARLT